MKTTAIFAAIAVSATSLLGAEFQLENKTNVAIIKIKTASGDTIKTQVAAGKSKKISLPSKYDKEEKITIYLEDYRQAVVNKKPKNLSKVSIKLNPDAPTLTWFGRNANPDLPEGQIIVKSVYGIKKIVVFPNEDWEDGEFKTCPLIDAERGIYQFPTDVKYDLTITTNVKKCGYPWGYDFRKISELLLAEKVVVTVKTK